MEVRPAGPEDVEAIRWALYTALAWNPDRVLPPFEFVLQHPEAERYHRDWCRPGDLGFVATLGDDVLGVEDCGLFVADDHGHGYVDAETPELAVAVRDGNRGEGIGARLLRGLAELA